MISLSAALNYKGPDFSARPDYALGLQSLLEKSKEVFKAQPDFHCWESPTPSKGDTV